VVQLKDSGPLNLVLKVVHGTGSFFTGWGRRVSRIVALTCRLIPSLHIGRPRALILGLIAFPKWFWNGSPSIVSVGWPSLLVFAHGIALSNTDYSAPGGFELEDAPPPSWPCVSG